MKKSIFVVALLMVGIFIVPAQAEATGLSQAVELEGFAWASSIGWISMNCSNTDTCVGGSAPGTKIGYKVQIETDGRLTGYAWSPNIGWIKFGGLSDFPSGMATIGSNATSTGTYPDIALTGWARACAGMSDPENCSGSGVNGNSGTWDGWISLGGAGEVSNIEYVSYADQHCGLVVDDPDSSVSIDNVLLTDGTPFDIYDGDSSTATLRWSCTGPDAQLAAEIESACGLRVNDFSSPSVDNVLLQDGSTYDLDEDDQNGSTATLEWSCMGPNTKLVTEMQPACGFEVNNPGSSPSLDDVLLQDGVTTFNFFDGNNSTATLEWSCAVPAYAPSSFSYGVVFVDRQTTADSFAWGGPATMGWIDFSPTDSAGNPFSNPVTLADMTDIVISDVGYTPGTPSPEGFYTITFNPIINGIPVGSTVNWELTLGTLIDSGYATQTNSGLDFSSIPTLSNVPFSIDDTLTLVVDSEPAPNGTVTPELDEVNEWSETFGNLAFPPPVMTITGPTAIRSGDSADITWTLSAPYPVTCSLNGSGVTVSPDPEVPVGAEAGNVVEVSGVASTGQLYNSSRVEFTCVVGPDTYTEVFQIEVIPTFQEI